MAAEIGTYTGILALIQTHGYIVMFLVMLIEGPIATYMAAFVASTGLLNIYIVLLLSALGYIIPDSILFFIGKYSRTKFIEKILTKVGLHKKRMKNIEKNLGKHLWKSIFMFKLTPGLAIPSLILAGLTKMKFKKIFVICTLFNVVSALLFSALGFYSGIAAESILKYLRMEQYITPILVLLTVVIYLVIKRIKKKIPKTD